MRVLVVDDEEIKRVSLVDDLRDAGFEVTDFSRGEPALERLKSSHADALIVDLKMPGLSGLDVLREARRACPETDVVLMTAYGTIQTAVEAMRLGAYDYVTKPFSSDEMIMMLERLSRQRRLQRSNAALRISAADSFGRADELIAASPPMIELMSQVRRIAQGDAHVLLTGETGVGKDMIAKAIHEWSPRAERPFVKITCATFAAQLLESELFGRERGAYTGADKAQPGRFELADEGTVYLDDVDDIPLDSQVRLLRVIEEQVIERVGGPRLIPIDVRVVASTKKDLGALVAAGQFRADLFYRLSVVNLTIPPLRERPEDIRPLFDHFCRSKRQECSCSLPADTLRIMTGYCWPGNLRELRNLVERWNLLKHSDAILPTDLPPEVRHFANLRGNTSEVCPRSFDEALRALERRLLADALEQSGGNKSRAAKLLGLKPSTFRNKLAQHDLDRE